MAQPLATPSAGLFPPACARFVEGMIKREQEKYKQKEKRTCLGKLRMLRLTSATSYNFEILIEALEYLAYEDSANTRDRWFV